MINFLAVISHGYEKTRQSTPAEKTFDYGHFFIVLFVAIEDEIIEIRFDWEPTVEEMAIVN